MKLNKTTIGILLAGSLFGVLLFSGCSKEEPAANGGTAAAGAETTRTGETSTPAGAQTPPVAFRNAEGKLLCPVMGTVIESEDNTVGFEDYKGKRYYFCCAECTPRFKKNPEKFADGKAMPKGGAKTG